MCRNKEYEKIYEGEFSAFNPIQTQTFNAVYTTDDPVLVSAPTGSGKTVIAELAILRMLNQAANEGYVAKAVYVAPTKPVLETTYQSWSGKFEPLGLQVECLTGEPLADVKILDKAHIAMATPEAWEALSRRWRQRKAVQKVSLFIVDELHLVGGRAGPTIEVGTSRVRYMSSHLPKPVRIVALSASLANARDIGDWIGASPQKTFNFPPSARPVPVEIHINGFDISSQIARMEAMARPAFRAVDMHASAKEPALIFVPTRKHAKKTALDMLTFAAAEGDPSKFSIASADDIEPFLEKVKDPALRHSLSYGVGYLHESQSKQEQKIVRTLYGTGAIQLLVAAASTAWTISSNAKLIVIMGTQYYDAVGHASNDYTMPDLLQMVGRSGRPGIDSRAVYVSHNHQFRFIV